MSLRDKIGEYLDNVAQIRSSRGASYALAPLLIPLTIAFFILVFLFSNWSARITWIKDKIDPNKVFVETIGLNSNEQVIIKWTCDSYCDTVIVYDKNKVQSTDFKTTGNNILLVYLNDSLIYTETQYKRSHWEGYEYYFKISKEGIAYITELTIED